MQSRDARFALCKVGPPREDALMSDLTRQEVDAKLAASEAKADARLANFDTSIKTGFADLALAMQKQSSDLSAGLERQSGELRVEMAQMRAEMAKQTGEMRTEMANVRGESHKSTTEITRWVVGFGIAILGTIFTLSKVSEKPAAVGSPPSAQQQTPLVIAVPAGSALLNPPPQAPANPSAPSAK